MEELTLTHHCIDQFPGLDDLPPQDQAMDAFRRLFPVIQRTIIVSADGRVMKYRLRGTGMMKNYLEMARLIIITHQLPLQVHQDLFEIGGIQFENNLVITYKPR